METMIWGMILRRSPHVWIMAHLSLLLGGLGECGERGSCVHFLNLQHLALAQDLALPVVQAHSFPWLLQDYWALKGGRLSWC